MKLMTLNTHSLIGEDCIERAERFCSALPKLAPDVLALQEVNQTANAALLAKEEKRGFIPCGGRYPLRQDNYAAQVAGALREAGLFYFWTWLPVKRGYEKYDEGLALFCRFPVLWAKGFFISRNRAYDTWRTRMGLMVQLRDSDTLFCNLHMSWWQDEEEPFLWQWQRVEETLPSGKTKQIWLMGDFNNSAHVRQEGYDCMTHAGWYDSYRFAGNREGEATVEGSIDGWREQRKDNQRLRIDQIWCNQCPKGCRYQTVFDGKHQPIVSDHFGVMVTV